MRTCHPVILIKRKFDDDDDIIYFHSFWKACFALTSISLVNHYAYVILENSNIFFWHFSTVCLCMPKSIYSFHYNISNHVLKNTLRLAFTLIGKYIFSTTLHISAFIIRFLGFLPNLHHRSALLVGRGWEPIRQCQTKAATLYSIRCFMGSQWSMSCMYM